MTIKFSESTKIDVAFYRTQLYLPKIFFIPQFSFEVALKAFSLQTLRKQLRLFSYTFYLWVYHYL